VGRNELRRTTFDLSGLAREIVADIERDQPRRQVQVTIAPSMPVHADKHHMRIALDNLLRNAWKFTGKTSEPRIEIGVQHEGDVSVYFVRDNGVGFDMAYASKLFQPFQRMHRTDEFEGTGIGLATVQRVISRHGGRVWAESAVNHGTTIRFIVDQRAGGKLWIADQGVSLLRLHWHESYNCGEPTIDLAHRRLFELGNALIDAAFTRDANPQQFDFAFEELLAHAVRHFEDEEALLAQYGYAELDAHVHAHKMLVERALQFRDAAATGGIAIGETVGFLANEVVARHVVEADRQFYPLFKRPDDSSSDSGRS
jgi:hemerythrin-like metal-binding protein